MNLSKDFTNSSPRQRVKLLQPTSIFTLRKYIAKAKKDGFLEYNPYDDFEIHEGTKAKKPSLTTADIAAIEALTEEQLNALGKNCVVLRDRFLFSCYTGLRISDNINLRKSNIHKNKNGLTLQMKTKKTEETVTLLQSGFF